MPASAGHGQGAAIRPRVTARRRRAPADAAAARRHPGAHRGARPGATRGGAGGAAAAGPAARANSRRQRADLRATISRERFRAQSGLGLVDLARESGRSRAGPRRRSLPLPRARGGALAADRRHPGRRDQQSGERRGGDGGAAAAPRPASRWRSPRPSRLRRAIAEVFAGRLRDDARTRCPEAFSCRGWTEAPSRWRWAALGFAGAIGVAAAPLVALQLVVAWVLLANAMTMGLRLVAIFARLRGPRQAPAGDAARLADYKKLPRVSILVPLLREEAVAEQLLAGARRDGLPGAAARHQARARGRRRDHPRRDRPRRAAADDRGGHRARRRPADQAAGDELRAALLPRRHRRGLRRRGPARPGPDPRGGPAPAGGAARGRLRAGLSRLLQLGRQLAGALLHHRVRDLVPGGAARRAAARAADPARRHHASSSAAARSSRSAPGTPTTSPRTPTSACGWRASAIAAR